MVCQLDKPLPAILTHWYSYQRYSRGKARQLVHVYPPKNNKKAQLTQRESETAVHV